MRFRILLAALAAVASLPAQRKVSDEEVARVHKAAFLIDTHNDVTSRTVTGFDIGPRAATGHTDIVRLREGGVGAQFFAVYVASTYVEGNRSANRTLQMIDTVRHDIIGKYPAVFQYATSVKEIEAARANGKIAALMGIEGGHAIEDSLRLLRDFYALGIRYMTLTHSNTNNWADSSGDMTREGVKHHNGLTEFGKDVVREMNRLGMLVDIAHVADKTFYDALEVSKAPIFSSHSSCRALCDVPRNMTDEMIRALAKKGGVIQINFSCGFLSQAVADANRAAGGRGGRSGEAGAPQLRATLADVVAHIDHVRKIAGIDAIGIGGDFDGVGCTPDGLDDVSKYPNLTRALLEKGYTAAEITKIYSGNVLRVMRAVEVAAGK